MDSCQHQADEIYRTTSIGIYIFPEDAVVGESAIKALGLDDVVIEYEITSNRVDCYGVLGIAREVAATFDKKFIPPGTYRCRIPVLPDTFLLCFPVLRWSTSFHKIL